MSLISIAIAAAFAPGLEAPRAAMQSAPARSVFKCQDGRDLTAEFATRGADLVAIVDAGDGPHALPIRPWTSGPVRLTWSDGRRTLVWNPGVQIHWMDGATHRACGRGEHRH